MAKMLRLIPALGAVLFALIGLSACGGGGGIPGNAVISVDGTPITKAAFNHWLSVAAYSSSSGPFAQKVTVPDPPNYTKCIAHFKEVAEGPEGVKKKPTEAELKKQCELQYKSLSQEVLGFLTSSQWVLGEAKSLGVKVSDKEVRKQFEKIKNQQFPKVAEFEKFLTTSGQTVSDLLLRVKLNMLSQKIQAKIVKSASKVSDEKISKYYNQHRSNYGQQEKRNVEIILTKTEAQAKSAKKEVESGKNFASVSKARSNDPSVRNAGGQLNEVTRGQQEAALDKAIFSAQANTLTGPVKGAFGYYVFRVKSITGGSQQTLAQAKPSIKAQLAAQQQQKVLTKFVGDFKKKWKAKTDCRKAYVVPNCKQSKEPKKKGTGTTGSKP